MRNLKWISLLTILAMLFAMLPATVAEDGIVIDPVEVDGEALEIEMDDVELLDSVDDSALALEDTTIELDGLENDLLISETEEAANAPVASNASEDFVIDEEGTLTKYNGFDKNIVIPDEVKAIGYGVFESYDIETVIIPEGVASIGATAFRGCKKLKSIGLPGSLTEIGYLSFADCISLTSISIPKNVTSLGWSAFDGCSNLTSVQISGNIAALTNGEFSGSGLKSLDFLAGSGITEISGGAFRRCDGLESITIPDSVTTIGDNAFYGCTNLESVTIPASVTSIDRSAFNDSTNVTIRGTAGTYAERFANGVGIPFNAPVVTIDDKTTWIYDDSGSYDALILYINHSRTLNAVQKPADLARTLSWSSSDTSVVTVDKDGKIKGVAPGTATITAKTADGKGKAAEIKVFVPDPTSIELNYNYWSGNNTVTLYQTSSISASTDTPYQYKTKVEMPITWSSSDASIISIEKSEANEATLKGNKLGRATITATTPDGGKASMELEVIRPEVDDIKIDQSGPITLHPGDQTKLTATLSPEGAESALTWGSYDTDVVTVGSDGTITAVAEGYAEIWVKTTNNRTAYIEINVIPLHPHPDSIKIDQSGPIKLYVGKQCTLTASMTPADAEAKLTWSSWNTDIATVNQDGVVTAIKEGYTEIQVETDNGYDSYIEVEVLPTPSKVKLNKTKATLGVKEKLTLKVTLTPADAKTTLSWKSSNPKVAAVTKKGVVVGKKVGTTVITVTAANGYSAEATITVKAAPDSVTLNKSGTVTLKRGKTLKLKATLPKKTASALTWKSSKPKIASVDQKGVVRALKKGTAVITVKTFNGKTAKVTIRVK